MIDWLRRLRRPAPTTPEAAAAPDGPPSLPRSPEELARDCLLGDQPEAALALLEGTTSLAGLTMAGEAALALGRRASALSFFTRALARDPGSPGLRDRVELLGGGEPAADAGETLAVAAPSAPFRIVRELGRGGSATVFEALDEALGRRVALKVYHQPEARRAELEREARFAVLAAGEGVVPVYDADPSEGWIALGLAEGSLAAHPEPASRWLALVAAALLRAHARGFVHGDVKPGNLLSTPSTTWLSDFGTATRIGEAYEGGTPGYLSPSRGRREPAREADDVFALARTLEHLGERDLAARLDDGTLSLGALAARR